MRDTTTPPLTNLQRIYFASPPIVAPMVGYALLHYNTAPDSYSQHSYYYDTNNSVLANATNDFGTMLSKNLYGYLMIAFLGQFSVFFGMIVHDNPIPPPATIVPYEGMRFRCGLMFSFFVDHFHNIYGLNINGMRGVIFLSGIQTAVYSSFNARLLNYNLQQAANDIVTCTAGSLVTSAAFESTRKLLTWTFCRTPRNHSISPEEPREGADAVNRGAIQTLSV